MIPHAELKFGDPIWLARGFDGVCRASIVAKDAATGLCWASTGTRVAFIPPEQLMFRTRADALAGNDDWLRHWKEIELGFAQLTSDEIASLPDDAEHADQIADLKAELAVHRAFAYEIDRWLTPQTTPYDPSNDIDAAEAASPPEDWYPDPGPDPTMDDVL